MSIAFSVLDRPRMQNANLGHLATYWSGGALRLLPPSALAKAIFAGYLKHVASGAPAQESHHRLQM